MNDVLKARATKLRTAATIWSDGATDATTVGTNIAPAVNQGDKFGVLAGSSGVSGNYNTWIEAMHQATKDASKNFNYLAAALRAVADDFDGVDATVAESVESLDRRI